MPVPWVYVPANGPVGAETVAGSKEVLQEAGMDPLTVMEACRVVWSECPGRLATKVMVTEAELRPTAL